MTRAVLAAALLTAVTIGGFFIGITQALADEAWPDW